MMTIEQLMEKYPHFHENKIQSRRTRVFTLIKKPDACFYYRVLNPHEQLVRQFGWECRYIPIDPTPDRINQGIPTTISGDDSQSLRNLIDCHEENLAWADIIVMQRPTCSHHLELMRYIQRELKKPVIYEADDNYIDVPKHNPGYEYFEPRAAYIKDMITEADALTVTTEYLADIYRTLHRNHIVIAPNSINFETLDGADTNLLRYEQKDRRKYFMPMRQLILGKDDTSEYTPHIRNALERDCQRRGVTFSDSYLNSLYEEKKDLRFQVPDEVYAKATDGRMVIGWGGSPTHSADLAVITEPLMKVLKEDPKLILGMAGFIHGSWPELMNREQLWQFGLVPVVHYYSFYKQIGMTIGLAPVNRDQFNRGKSPLKAVEYMALGVYAIASDYDTYQGLGPDVPLCSTLDQWEKAIKDSLYDEGMRFEVVQNNRKYVEQHYNIATNVQIWKDCYERFL